MCAKNAGLQRLPRLLLVCSLLGAISAELSAQNIKVSGTVSEKDGEPVIGATVRLKDNATTYTLSDLDGKYELPRFK